MAARRGKVVVHTATEVRGIRVAAQVAAQVREQLRSAIRPGQSTLEIDRLAAALIAQHGARPAFLNYRGFPANICVSVNDEVVHGIGAAGRIVQVGDLLSIDVGVKIDGCIGDTAFSMCVGGLVTPEAGRLLQVTEESLERAIGAACGGNHVSDIGVAVERHAVAAGFSVVRDFVGHGCGCELHEAPEVPNFRTPQRGPKLLPGMVLALEPMINAGTDKVTVDADGWTVRTADGRLSAHFEHMVLITDKEAEVLTWAKM